MPTKNINHRKSICFSRPLSMKQAAKIMHVCSVKTKNPPEQILLLEQTFIGTFPLNIIYNALFLFCTYSLHTFKCSDDFGYCSYSHLIFPILFQKAKTYVTRDGLFAFDLWHFQTTCVLITRLSDCNPIRAFETFDISTGTAQQVFEWGG